MKSFNSIKFFIVIAGILLSSLYSFSQSSIVDVNVEKLYNELSLLRNTDDMKEVFLPMPDGKFKKFKAKENNTISGEFKMEYPGILSFDIVGVDDPLYRGALTITHDKMYASILSEEGLIGIWPSKNRGKYKVYIGNDDPELGNIPRVCGSDDSVERDMLINQDKNNFSYRTSGSNGEVLRTYRLVLVCTGEFYQANGNNNGAVNSLITAIVNGWNVILKNNLSVKLVLSRSPYLYKNKNTDPFIPNGDGGEERTTQAVNAINSKFNKAVYDIGHVLHNHSPQMDPYEKWDNGGLAALGVVCSDAKYYGANGGPRKAAGWSGSYDNQSNSYIGLSVHEVGHQFNMKHTFNGTGESCTDNISDVSAYEIGSGTTLMSYNGICSSDQNIPSYGTEDDYYHINSIERALEYINTYALCSTVDSTGNHPPVVEAGPSYTIPKGTPFYLTGEASDVDGDKLTYCWEEYDEDGTGHPTQGMLGASAANSTIAPLFRSYAPTTDPVRYFPHKDYILDGHNRNLPFEALPNVTRTMNFKLTVRDNFSGGGGVAWDETQVSVTSSAGPFEIRSQNSNTTLTANGSNTFELKWNVANTDKSPVNCSEVEIYFSVDGGKTFPYFLGKTPNDGSVSLLVPNLPTNLGRIMLKASDNIFFDINNSDIVIESDCEAVGTSFVPDTNVVGENNGEIDERLNLSLEPVYGNKINKFTGSVTTGDLPSYLVYQNVNSCAVATGNEVYYDIYQFQVTKSGTYTFQLTGTFGLVLNFYESEYNEDNLCYNMIKTNAVYPGSGNVSISSVVSVPLIEGKKYFVRISSFSSSFPTLPANYNLSVKNKPSGAALYDDVPPPPTGFYYTFIAYDTESDVIEAINEYSDFRYVNPGTYYVQGISVSTDDSLKLNGFAGKKFSELLDEIINSNICANLSSNKITITVFNSGCSVVDAGLDNIQCNDNGTNMDPSDDYISFSLNPVESSTSGSYAVIVPEGYNVSPDTALFDVVTQFNLNEGSAGKGNIPASIDYEENCSFVFSIQDPGTCSDCTNADARINEFHYDNKGSDKNEFVEVFVKDPQPDSLFKYKLILYNGSNGKKYNEETLDNMTVTYGDGGAYYVWEPASIQNGSPDGIALIGECGNTLEFLSYEGSFTASDGDAEGETSVDVLVSESSKTPLDGSLQLIDSVWVQTIAYNTKGELNSLGACIIADAYIIDVECHDNATSYDPSDDYLTFSLLLIGNQLEGSYSIFSDNGDISPQTALYADTASFTLFSGSAQLDTIFITVRDVDDNSCVFEFAVVSDGTCSPDCKMTDAGLSNIRCDNNNTPNYAGDDKILFDLNPAGYNLTGKYNVNSNKYTIDPANADYGKTTTFEIEKGSAGNGDVVISVSDKDDDTCELDITVADPGVCSTSAVNELGENKHSVNVFPNPANSILNISTNVNTIVKYKIVNNLGKKVNSGKYKDRINILPLRQSVYYILFYDKDNNIVDVVKFVKE